MDGSRFDRLARRLAHGVSRRQVLHGMGLGVLGILGLVRSGSSAPAPRVEVCHFDDGVGTRMQVPERAVAAHLRHGDVVATPFGTPCLDFEPVDPIAACGARCEGPGVAGESDGYLGCVPDGEHCGAFALCCSGICTSPLPGSIGACGGCRGAGRGPCTDDSHCCPGLLCGPVDGFRSCVAGA